MWSPVGPALRGDSLSLTRTLCPQHENAGGDRSRSGVSGDSFLLLTCHRRALEPRTSPAEAEPLKQGLGGGGRACRPWGTGVCGPAGDEDCICLFTQSQAWGVIAALS